MKKILILMISLVSCGMIAACNDNLAANADNAGENPPASSSAAASETSTDQSAESDESVDYRNEMDHAYSTALENLIENHIFPNGTDCEDSLGDLSENKFAVYDVDHDGKEELLLMYTDACMACQIEYVFGYDGTTKELQTELSEFPMLTFYDNGIIKAGWSHNQGLAGDFWPYSLYQYAPDSDSYGLVGMVDAWEKKYWETDDQNHPFPSDVDQSGTGFVYYIMKDGQYDNTHPVDASVYNEWVNTYMGSASEIQIPYLDLTKENISQLGNGA